MTVRLAYRAYHIFHFVVLRYNFSGEPSYLKVLSICKMENLAYIRILGRSEPFSALPAVFTPCVFGIIVIPVRITGLIDFSYLCLIALVFHTICVARCCPSVTPHARYFHLLPVLPNPFLSALPKMSTSSNSISGWHL